MDLERPCWFSQKGKAAKGDHRKRRLPGCQLETSPLVCRVSSSSQREESKDGETASAHCVKNSFWGVSELLQRVDCVISSHFERLT